MVTKVVEHLMCIQVHKIKNTFTGLKFPSFQCFTKNKYELQKFRKEKNYQNPSGSLTHDQLIHIFR